MAQYIYGNSIPDFLLRYRERHRLTQRELARRLGVTPAYVCQIEKGSMPCPMRFSVRLSKLLTDVELDYFAPLIEDSYHARLVTLMSERN